MTAQQKLNTIMKHDDTAQEPAGFIGKFMQKENKVKDQLLAQKNAQINAGQNKLTPNQISKMNLNELGDDFDSLETLKIKLQEEKSKETMKEQMEQKLKESKTEEKAKKVEEPAPAAPAAPVQSLAQAKQTESLVKNSLQRFMDIPISKKQDAQAIAQKQKKSEVKKEVVVQKKSDQAAPQHASPFDISMDEIGKLLLTLRIFAFKRILRKKSQKETKTWKIHLQLSMDRSTKNSTKNSR